ncbi:uncharacterized protein [Onthophagus taurus]|uniref:uncharacterized protein n=1 Tax=Onthophagus taurus TaxID=166361 RepID=UPI0039BE37AB
MATHIQDSINIQQLPSEVTSLILRNLDGRSLINAARVCRGWSNVCDTDPILKTTMRKQESKRRRLRWCRARYGDGVIRNGNLKGPRGVVLRRKIRIAQYKCLLTLMGLKSMWESFYYYLLFYDRDLD